MVSGYSTPCEVGDADAFGRLRAVYPLILLAALFSLGAAACSIAQGERARRTQRTLGGVGGTLATMQLALALLLTLAVAIDGVGMSVH